MLFLFSPRDPRAPSSSRHETLPHDPKLVRFYNPGPKILGPGALRRKISRGKNVQNLAQFRTTSDFDCKYGVDGDIKNQETNVSTAVPPMFGEKSWVNCSPLRTKFWMCIVTHLNQLFQKTIFRPRRGCCPSNFCTC